MFEITTLKEFGWFSWEYLYTLYLLKYEILILIIWLQIQLILCMIYSFKKQIQEKKREEKN